MATPTVVLDLESLRVEAWPRPSHVERWFHCRVAATAPPFAGAVETIVTPDDLLAFADDLDRLDPTGDATLGGGRAAELRLVVEAQVGGDAGDLVVECALTPQGDDPFPQLRWLTFGVRPFGAAAAGRLRALARPPAWPAPDES
jgi:hypothetical protein